MKMYKIMDGERVAADMPVSSVDRAMKKGWILEESAQKLEMPMEILEVMKKPEPVADPVVAKSYSVEPAIEPMPEAKEVKTNKPMGRPKRK